METLFRGLDAAVNVGEGLLKAQRLRLKGAFELTGLDGLALTELAQEVALEVGDLAHQLHEAEVDVLGRDRVVVAVETGRPFAVVARASRFCGRRPSSALRKAPQEAQKSAPSAARVLQTGQVPLLGAAGTSAE